MQSFLQQTESERALRTSQQLQQDGKPHSVHQPMKVNKFRTTGILSRERQGWQNAIRGRNLCAVRCLKHRRDVAYIEVSWKSCKATFAQQYLQEKGKLTGENTNVIVFKGGIAEYEGDAEQISVGRVSADSINIVQRFVELESAFPNKNIEFRKTWV